MGTGRLPSALLSLLLANLRSWELSASVIKGVNFFFSFPQKCFIIIINYCHYSGVTLWHLQTFLQYIIVEIIPSSFSFIPPLPTPGIVSTGLIFPFT
jgi:hypothetical protein